MTDDIVTRFRSAADRCTHGNERFYNGPEGIEMYFEKSCILCVSWREAADIIEQLRENDEYLKNIIEMLRNEARNERS
jgi:hypothetical protein